MAEYISREAFKARIREQQKKCASPDEIATFTVFSFLLQAVDEEPAADVQPEKHGRWLSHHAIWIGQPKIEGWFVQAKCSEGEKWAHVMNPYTKSVDYECCPHCGARMDGDAEC